MRIDLCILLMWAFVVAKWMDFVGEFAVSLSGTNKQGIGTRYVSNYHNLIESVFLKIIIISKKNFF